MQQKLIVVILHLQWLKIWKYLLQPLWYSGGWKLFSVLHYD